jgi:hypothetical protein
MLEWCYTPNIRLAAKCASEAVTVGNLFGQAHIHASRTFFADAVKSILTSDAEGGKEMQLPCSLYKRIRGSA